MTLLFNGIFRKKKTKHIVRTHETTRNSMQGIDHIKRWNAGLDPVSVVQKLGRGAAREDFRL